MIKRFFFWFKTALHVGSTDCWQALKQGYSNRSNVCQRKRHETYTACVTDYLCDLTQLVELARESWVRLRVHGSQATEFDPHVHPARTLADVVIHVWWPQGGLFWRRHRKAEKVECDCDTHSDQTQALIAPSPWSRDSQEAQESSQKEQEDGEQRHCNSETLWRIACRITGCVININTKVLRG